MHWNNYYFASEIFTNPDGENDVIITNICQVFEAKSCEKSWEIWLSLYQGTGTVRAISIFSKFIYCYLCLMHERRSLKSFCIKIIIFTSIFLMQKLKYMYKYLFDYCYEKLYSSSFIIFLWKCAVVTRCMIFMFYQLLYTGMLETTKIRREGFAVRPSFPEFVDKYVPFPRTYFFFF